jgi:hypothetical protein
VVLHLSKRLKDIPESVARTLDMLGVLVVLADWEGTVLYANKAAKVVLDRARDNLLHVPHTEVRSTSTSSHTRTSARTRACVMLTSHGCAGVPWS